MTVLDLVEANVPAFDDDPAANVPAAGRATAGTTPPPAVALSPDELTAAVVSAMTLFGRCEVRRVKANPQFSNGRWVAP